jgi:hypothetical protein
VIINPASTPLTKEPPIMNHGKYTGWRKSTYSNSTGDCVEVATAWRKSTYSDSSGNCVEVAAATPWHKSTYSNSSANCVEVASLDPVVGIRDSKQRGGGPVLEFTATAWSAFLAAVKDGKFDL